MTANIIVSVNTRADFIATLFLYDSEGIELFNCYVLGIPDKLPYGIHNCTWSYMSSHKVHHYVINVPGHTGIFIHAGNTSEDSSGCLLLGSLLEYFEEGDVFLLKQSKRALKRFETILKRKPFQLNLIKGY